MLLKSVNQCPTHILWLVGFLSEIPGRFPLSLAYCRHYIHRFLTIARKEEKDTVKHSDNTCIICKATINTVSHQWIFLGEVEGSL